MKDDRVYLGHILECLDAIVGYVSEGRSKFLADRKTQKATLRELQEPAESPQRLASALKDRHPDLPWAAIAGFRNVLVHDYLGISLSRVWDITQRDLPALRAALVSILAEKDTGDSPGSEPLRNFSGQVHSLTTAYHPEVEMTTKKSPSDRSVVDKISDAVYSRLEKVIESEREKGSREVLVQSLVHLGIATALMKLLVQHGLTPALAIESFAKGHRLTEEQLEAMDRRLYRGIVDAVETHLGNEADLIGFRMDFAWRGKAPGAAK